MKKIIITMTTLCAITLGSFAAETTNCFSFSEPSASRTNARIIYDGPAYAVGGSDGFIPCAGDSVQIYWTTDGFFVNGKEYNGPQQITGGGYAMKVNGRLKYMNYRVSVGDDYYYFQA